jgi:hypothetical protein
MRYDEVQIVIGNKFYQANSIDWIQSPDTYPVIKASAIVNPYNYRARSTRYNKPTHEPLVITNVIFNPPATIVFWSDKTKTVVKCGDQDIYDPEKGMAMAISRKMLGDKREYYNTFVHWMKKYKKQEASTNE